MQLYSFSFSAMGTVCQFHLYTQSFDAARLAAETGAAEVGRLEKRYSRYRPDSVLSRINRIAAIGGTIRVDEEAADLIDYAFTCHKKSGGLFDITSGLLRKAWDFSSPHLPEQGQIQDLLPLVGLQKLIWTSPDLGFPVAGMEIDLGGIVKEYAADRAAEFCMACGIVAGLVELGGDIRAIGPHPDGTPWDVQIRHPREPDAIMAVMTLSGGGLASSGDYERFIEVDGKRYCHLLDPRTGWPVSGLSSVSVVAESCLVAGSIASIAMLKQDMGVDWLQTLGLETVWRDEDGRQGQTLPSPKSL